MAELKIPHKALVLVGDGEKALFLRNRGNPLKLDLVVERILEQDNPATREQGTDRPGRAFANGGSRRAAMEETDWHRLGEERFASDIARSLQRHCQAEDFKELVVVAPPRVLGALRRAFAREVVSRICAEVPKELTTLPVPEIQRVLAA
jgi:protein required for attachment to host cells